MLIVDSLYRDLVAAARSDQVMLDASTYEDVASKGPVPERPNDSLTVDSAEMYYTSGTSGRPKGVVLSRRTVILHALGCMIEHRIHGDDVWLHCAPMFHLVDAYAIFAVTWVGGAHVTLPAFAAAAVFDAEQTPAERGATGDGAKDIPGFFYFGSAGPEVAEGAAAVVRNMLVRGRWSYPTLMKSRLRLASYLNPLRRSP